MLAVALLAFLSCAGTVQSPPRQLVVAAFTAPNRVYEEALFPAFCARWEAETGEQIELVGSFRGSGAQTRTLLAGYPADVAALALEPDMDRLAEAGLIQHDWRAAEHGGMVSRSLVALAVRPGNPKGIAGWDDLSRPDLTVLTPDPASSGGAQWNLAALVGAVQHTGTSAPGMDSAVCEALLAAVLARVPAMDAGARESMLRFEKGEGDVAITYESEVFAARAAGQRCDLLLPPATLLVEHPAAVLDRNVDAHATRDLAEAFLRFLHGPEAQRAFAEHGFRPVDEAVLAAHAAAFPVPPGLFTVRNLGGWAALHRDLFDPGGLYERASARAAQLGAQAR